MINVGRQKEIAKEKGNSIIKARVSKFFKVLFKTKKEE